MTRGLVVDLFCGGGGASAGYAAAGFTVIGVDRDPQPHYPFRFIQADALDILRNGLPERTVFVHASPPCQASSPTVHYRKRNAVMRTPEPVNLITPVRDLLRATALPYVIENVPYQVTGLVNPVTLCGTMFGLPIYRHRWFEFSRHWGDVTAPTHQEHTALYARNGYLPTRERPFMTITGRNGHHSRAWVKAASLAMGTPWLWQDLNAVCEAIPPRYTRWVGQRWAAA